MKLRNVAIFHSKWKVGDEMLNIDICLKLGIFQLSNFAPFCRGSTWFGHSCLYLLFKLQRSAMSNDLCKLEGWLIKKKGDYHKKNKFFHHDNMRWFKLQEVKVSGYRLY